MAKLMALSALTLIMLLAGCGDEQLHFDKNGFPHGTGEDVIRYADGSIMIREDYRKGVLVRSRWFKPDGTLIKETDWTSGRGEGLRLRNDGSIEKIVPYVNGVAEGEAKIFSSEGVFVKIENYKNGVLVSSENVSANNPPASRDSGKTTLQTTTAPSDVTPP